MNSFSLMNKILEPEVDVGDQDVTTVEQLNSSTVPSRYTLNKI